MAQTLDKLKVLIVDDESDSRHVLKGALEDIGIKNVVEAPDARDAYYILDKGYQKIDMVLCDWNMPQITGIDLLERIRKRGNAIPFFMISGRSDHGSIVTAKNTGVTGYIRKPFSPNQIEAKLRATLHRIEPA